MGQKTYCVSKHTIHIMCVSIYNCIICCCPLKKQQLVFILSATKSYALVKSFKTGSVGTECFTGNDEAKNIQKEYEMDQKSLIFQLSGYHTVLQPPFLNREAKAFSHIINKFSFFQ